MLTLLAGLFCFLALVTGSVAVFGPAMRRTPQDERILGLRQRAAEQGSAGPAMRRRPSSIPAFSRILSENDWADAMARDLRRANVQLRVGEFLMLRFLIGGFAFIVVAWLTALHPLGVVLALVLGVVGFFVPAFWLGMVRQRRGAQIERQLIDFAPMLASGLRSGFAFQQAVDLATRQIEPPLLDELKLFLNDANLGSTVEAALEDLSERVNSPDLDMIVTAVLVQRSSGGNLAEVLDQAAETLRERERIRGDLRTLTAQHRLTGIVLSLYPTAVGLVLLALMPSMWSILFTELAGQIMLGIAVGLQVLGFLILRRLMSLDI